MRHTLIGALFSVLLVGSYGCSSANVESYANPSDLNVAENKQQAPANDLSDKEVIDFLQKTYQAQMTLLDKSFEEKQSPDGLIDTIYHPLSHEEIKNTLKPYMTDESITAFIRDAGETNKEGWLPHDEEITGYLVDYEKDANKISFQRTNGQIKVTANVYVEEQSPAAVIATLSKTGNEWKVSKIDIQ